MKPKKRSKLPLSRETIRLLTSSELKGVAGGAVSYGGGCSVTHVTGIASQCGEVSIDQCYTDPGICG